MPELSYSEVEIISADVRRANINFSHLCDDLIDHICCDVESEMCSGISFREAYHAVRKKIGYGRLQEIQEDTLYAVDTKYRKMKTTMRISGIAGSVLFGFAALFKIQHWPMAGVMLTLGALILAFIFMPSALGVLWKETKSKNRLLLFIAVFLSAFFFIFGTLFKVQHWPGAGWLLLIAFGSAVLLLIPSLLAWIFSDEEKRKNMALYLLALTGLLLFITGLFFKIQHWPLASLLMVAGTVLLVIIALPWYTWLKWKDESHISSRFIFILLGLVIIILPAALVNLNLQSSYERGFYSHAGKQEEVSEWLYKNNSEILKAYSDSTCFETMKNLHQITDELCSYIGQLQAEMVQISEGKPGNPAIGQEQIVNTGNRQEIIYGKLTKPFDHLPVSELFTGDKDRSKDLKALLEEYNRYAGKIAEGSGISFKPSPLKADDFVLMAGNDTFKGSMMNNLITLEIIKNSVLATEARMLAELSATNKK